MPAIQLFLFKLKYFPTVWAVKIKSVSAAYKCLVSPPRESPPSALGPSRSAHPARPLWTPLPAVGDGSRAARHCTGRPSYSGWLRGPLRGRREGTARAGREPDPLRLPPSPNTSQARLRPQRAAVSLQTGFLEPCPWECLRWVPLQPPSLHEACRGRWFQFHAEKVSSPPPS